MSALLSVTTFREQYLLGVASGDATSITRLTAFLARAEERVVEYLGYPLQSGATIAAWSSGTYVLRLGGSAVRGRRLTVPVFPVTTVTSIYQDSLQIFTTTLVAPTDYETETLKNGAYIRLFPSSVTGSWLTGEREIKVTVTAGYANEAAIPTILADATYRLAQHRVARNLTSHLESKSAGGGSEQYSPDEEIPAPIRETLAAYRMIGSVGA